MMSPTQLIQKLDTSSDRAAEAVIRALVKHGRSAVTPLMRAARDREAPRIRKWSLQALGALGDKRAADLLIAALKDERMTVRLHAVRGLGRMRAKKSVKPLAALLADESGGIRINVVQSLIEIGDNSVNARLVKALSDPQWYVRQKACTACGLLGASKARKVLTQLAKDDPRKAVRSAAQEALSRLA